MIRSRRISRQRLSPAAQHLVIEVLLAAEIVTHVGDAHLGVGSDVADRDRGVAPAGEQKLGRVEQRLLDGLRLLVAKRGRA